MNREEIGTIIHNRRRQLRMKQQTLAELTGASAKTIYMIERGRGNPSLEYLQNICITLGLEISVQVKKVEE